MFFPVAIRDTFIENWKPDLLSLSVETASIKLDLSDTWVLGGFTPLFRRMTSFYGNEFFSEGFLGKIESATQRYNLVAPRIGYCSWKSEQIPLLASYQSRGVLYTICSENDRVARAIATHISSHTPLFLHLRKWCDIPPWAEFRIFIKERRIIGVSQYNHQSGFPEIATYEEEISASLYNFSGDLMDALHMDTVVADVFVQRQDDGSFQVRLLELNPFISRTDPCLYTWANGGDFDDGFRHRKL